MIAIAAERAQRRRFNSSPLRVFMGRPDKPGDDVTS
jgi:hypothetical protein